MAFQLANPELITPSILHKTSVPFLTPQSSQSTNGQTVDVSVCSEFKQYSIPATPIDGQHKLCITLDGDHQPMIFTVGSDSRLYCTRHISGDSWQSFDITPSVASAEVTAYDVFQHIDGNVAIGVAVKESKYGDATMLYYARPILATNADFQPSDISYVEIPYDGGKLKIDTVRIAATDTTMTSCFMFIGTAEYGDKQATDYIVSPASHDSPWVVLQIPEGATQVIKVVPATQRKPFFACAITLYQQILSSTPPELQAPDIGTALSCLTLDKKFNIVPRLKSIGGGARDISTTTTSHGLSDLYVAGIKGVGYYASQLMDRDPVVILPDISFKQIVASESNCQVSVLANSADGHLYFIEGKRASTGVVPTFYATGIPIRKNVSMISTQFNTAINACEAVYVDSEFGLVKHIWRDPGTSMWSEQNIHVRFDKIVSYPAFVSRIQLQGSAGAVVGKGYEVMVSSSEIAYVLVNDKTHRLTPTPVAFSTDYSGSIHIAAQTDHSISAPTIRFVIKGLGHEETVNVEMRQRIIRKYGALGSGADLKNAKSTAGEPIFPSTNIPDDTFDAVAQTLKQIPQLCSSVQSNAVFLFGQDFIRTSSKCVSLCYEKRGSAFHEIPMNGDWLVHAELFGLPSFGDIIEAVAGGILEVVKFGFEMVSGVLNLVAHIGGKIFRFVANAIGTVIRGVSTFLKDVLGIDLTRFLALFGFLWDFDNIKKTQQIIVRSAREGAETIKDIVTTNVTWMKGYFDSSRSLITPYIHDQRVPEADNAVHWKDLSAYFEQSFFGQLMKQIFDNPIIHEMMRYGSVWMLKVMSIIDEEVSFPGIEALENLLKQFATTVSKLIDKETDNIIRLFRDIFNKFGEFLSGKRSLGEFFTVLFSDTLWTLFDALEELISAFLDILPDVINAIVSMVTGAIKLPGISAFWEAWMETTFSIADVSSMFLAQVLYLVTMMWKEKLPFELMPPWYTMLPAKGTIRFPLSKNIVEASHFNAEFDVSSTPELSSAWKSSSYNPHLHAFLDLSFGLAASISVLFATGCSATQLFPTLREQGYNVESYAMLRRDFTGVDLEWKTYTTTNSLFTRAQFAFTGISIIMEFASFVNSAYIAENTVGKLEDVVPAIKFVALAMKSIDFMTATHGRGTPFTVALSPLANMLNSLPSGIISFIQSPKSGTDYLALSTSVLNGSAGAVDISTIVLNVIEQKELQWITVLVSSGLNVAQMITTFTYACTAL